MTKTLQEKIDHIVKTSNYLGDDSADAFYLDKAIQELRESIECLPILTWTIRNGTGEPCLAMRDIFELIGEKK